MVNQSLMHDQPQPACDSPKHNSGESGDCDHHGAPNRLSRSGRWGGSVIFQWLPDFVLAPIFLGLAFHRWRIRVFDLQPKRRAAQAIDRAELLADNPFAAKLARGVEN